MLALFRFLYRTFGPRTVWSLQYAMLGGTILLCLVFYRRLVPMTYPPPAVIQPIDDSQIGTKKV